MRSKKTIPDFATDEAAEEFVANADLSEDDLSEFVVAPIKFLQPAPNDFVPDEPLTKVKARAHQEGISPDHFIERVLGEAVEEAHR